jgi:putative Ca2+/H+ antiporter (TMEM165/GDT1 family)
MELFALLVSFAITALAELGNKTQLAVIALTAEYDTPVVVFLGVMLAFIVITELSVKLGAARAPDSYRSDTRKLVQVSSLLCLAFCFYRAP